MLFWFYKCFELIFRDTFFIKLNMISLMKCSNDTSSEELHKLVDLIFAANLLSCTNTKFKIKWPVMLLFSPLAMAS